MAYDDNDPGIRWWHLGAAIAALILAAWWLSSVGFALFPTR